MPNHEQLYDEKQVEDINETKKKENADIPGFAVAFVKLSNDSNQNFPELIQHQEFGTTNSPGKTAEDIHENSIFGAASLSKPVFTYLVIKLIDAGKLSFDTKLNENFSFEDFCKEVKLMREKSDIDKDKTWINMLDVRMILSHRSGLPITCKENIETLKLYSQPGTAYAYSGIGMWYLQKVIEKMFGMDLEALAKLYVFDHLKMYHSSFIPPAPLFVCAANSLQTTAVDYARFVAGWMREADKSENLRLAFNPTNLSNTTNPTKSMLNDDAWAQRENVSLDDLIRIAAGLGWLLQTDSKNIVIRAFHSGDMSEWRAFVAMDLVNKTAIVFFSNSRNGFLLLDKIITPKVELTHGLNYFFQKFNAFERTLEQLKAKEAKNQDIDDGSHTLTRFKK